MNPLGLPGAVELREVGPRDGLQNEAPVPTAVKLRLLEALVGAGLIRIEATAFVSPRAVPAMADAELVASALRRWPGVEWSALVAGVGGTRRALASGISRLQYVVSAADGHSTANVGRTTAESLALISSIVDGTNSAGGRCEVIVATAWDCPFDGPTPIDRVLDVVEAAVAQGAARVCLADTIGTATPVRIARLVEEVRDRHPDLGLGLHMHNTRGAGLAGILTALQLGVVHIDASVGGLGGCPFAPGASGNVATEEVVYLCRDMGVATGVDLDRLIETAQLAQRVLGRPLPSGVLRAGDRRRGRTTDRELRVSQ